MSIEKDIFKKYSADFDKLEKYGFTKKRGSFVLEKLFKSDEFRAEIVIKKTGEIQGKVYEVESNEEFLPLRVESQQGAFIGEVREEYKKILYDICQKCYTKNYFIYPQANRIANLIISKFGDKPDFMWDKFPDYGVFKNSKSSKWYGMVGDINYSKLDANINKPVEIINLKLDKKKIPELIKKDGFFPAWHMNKQSWITIVLDETLTDSEIMDLVEESYSYTVICKK